VSVTNNVFIVKEGRFKRSWMKKLPKHVSVSIPRDLIERIDKIIESCRYGYDSRPEFIKEAIRKRLEEIYREEAIS